MTVSNAYATLAEFKDYITPANQSLEISTPDDTVIEKMLTTAGWRVESLCARRFYPRIATMYYDVPDGDDLWLGDDLLALTTLTNGDTTVITSTYYTLYPANEYPKYAVKIKDTSTYVWETNSSQSSEQVITVLGEWGYHDRYGENGWTSAGTLGAAWASTTTLTATLTAGHTLLSTGSQVIKIDSEIMNAASTTSTGLTVVKRGDNGSTAATHLNGSTVYVWNVLEDIKQLTLEIAHIMYRSRWGENVETTSIATPAGVTITPRSLPGWAREVINRYQRRVY